MTSLCRSHRPSERIARWMVVGWGWLAVTLTAATWQAEIKPGAKDNFTQAAFSLWLDDSGRDPVALLVIAPGWNGDGRAAVNDTKWQSYARQQHLGLVGVCLRSNEKDESVPPYHVATQGSGAAFLTAIDRLATLAKKPALTKAPLLIWGHSAGGQFGYGMACFAPQRVLAFSSIKGGIYLSEPTKNTFTVPGLFICGENDEPLRAIAINRVFETGRAEGAPWCLAFEPNSGHEVGKSNELILPFFSGVLALGPRPVSQAGPVGWIGVRSSLEIKTGKEPLGEKLYRTVWLPDKAAAEAWRGYSNGGR